MQCPTFIKWHSNNVRKRDKPSNFSKELYKLHNSSSANKSPGTLILPIQIISMIKNKIFSVSTQTTPFLIAKQLNPKILKFRLKNHL